MSSHPVLTRAALLTSAVATALVTFAGTASASPSAPYLGYGSQGEGVKCVQIAVNWANAYPVHLAEDGVWGDQTQRGVVAFQRWKLGDAQADGVVGPNTGDKVMQILNQAPALAEQCYDYVPTHY
ncbi:peptidoglycan-binding protein [Streptomyces sp. NPDC056549]|uniref:peptidoglycan-binding domain-containing protein n=1 Tax=Streptomyces sp. NPDC056549 TaxID=3345864 RepID=UPI0036A8B6BD